MIELIRVVIILLIILAIITLLENRKAGRSDASEEVVDTVVHSGLDYFYLKNTFFSKSEYVLYELFHKIAGEQYIILSKVRIEDIIGVERHQTSDTEEIKKKKYGSRSRIKSRHIDFVLIDKATGKISMGVELDGTSHNTQKAQDIDVWKDSLFSHVSLPLHRIKVGEDFESKISELVIK